MVVIKVDSRQIKKLTRALRSIENGVPKVLVPAINRALAKGQTEVKREIRKEYLIKAKDIPTRVKRATTGNLSGAVIIQQGMLELAKFRYSPIGVQRRAKKKTLHVQVKKGGGGDISTGFVGVMPSGYIGPFMRETGAGRLPIHKLLTVGAPIMASQPAVGPAVQKAMGDTLAKRIDHEINRVLTNAGGHS